MLNVVLDALHIYAMVAMELPPSVVWSIDALRRSFLQSMDNKASGDRCLVSWDRVCRSKHEGWLGVRFKC